MSEVTGVEGSNDGVTDGGSSWNPPASQEELNRIISDRLNRERAKFGDYNELKSKAQKFDEFAESQKSEAQRAAEALKATETRANAAEAELARAKAALKYKLTDEDLDLIGFGSPEEIDSRAKRLAERLQPKAPDFDGGSRRSAGTPQNMNDVIRKAAGLG